MSKLPYGRFGNRYRKAGRAGGAPFATRNLRIRINGRYSLEYASQLFQRVIARLEDAGVFSIQDCAIYLVPLDADGEPVALRDPGGEPTTTLEIAMPVAAMFEDASG